MTQPLNIGSLGEQQAGQLGTRTPRFSSKKEHDVTDLRTRLCITSEEFWTEKRENSTEVGTSVTGKMLWKRTKKTDHIYRQWILSYSYLYRLVSRFPCSFCFCPLFLYILKKRGFVLMFWCGQTPSRDGTAKRRPGSSLNICTYSLPSKTRDEPGRRRIRGEVAVIMRTKFPNGRFFPLA